MAPLERPRPQSAALWRSIVTACLILPLALLSGCNLIGAAAVVGYKVAGPPNVDAKYTPARTPMLVLVENYAHQSTGEAQCDFLSRLLAQQIQVHDVAPVINPDQLQALKDEKPKTYPNMAITDIAHAVGATQVLYVQLQSSNANPLSGGEGFTGSASATVKLIDAASGSTLWPNDQRQYPVSVQIPIDSTQGASNPQRVQTQLDNQLADQVAKLFYAWQPEDMSPGTYDQ